MTLDSPHVIVEKSPDDVFNFLSDIKNFEALMPENISKFEVLSEDTFVFALKGMPEIALKKKVIEAPNKIVLGSADGKLDFTLTGHISAVEAEKSQVHLIFEGDFNPMMAMMIKKPISKFIETLAIKIPEAI